uniref:Uncharacterized protein n=1 Tax=Avena sativa TaxID=4498 RepID=A0ACD5Z5M9_AVESA
MTAETQLEQLLSVLTSITPNTHVAGDSRLMITTAKPPQTRDLYKLFNDRGMLWAPAKWIWLKAIPHRHKIFLWLAFRGRLNTKSNMVTKKWCSDGGCDQCPALETFEHIALHCRQADWVWDKLQIADTARKASELSALCDIQGQDAKTWPICIAACLPVLWQARNDRVFNQRQTNRATLLHNIAQCLSLWAHRSDKQKPKLIAWADLFENP